MFPSAFTTPDRLRLSCYRPQPLTGSLRARVILVHGLGDHSRSLPYRLLAEALGGRRCAVYHGEADTIVPPAGSAAFFAQLPGPEKARLTYPSAYHNLFIELNREQVFADIAQWIERGSHDGQTAN